MLIWTVSLKVMDTLTKNYRLNPSPVIYFFRVLAKKLEWRSEVINFENLGWRSELKVMFCRVLLLVHHQKKLIGWIRCCDKRFSLITRFYGVG